MDPAVPVDAVKFDGTLVGTISHYYDKISVAVVHAVEAFHQGDKVKIYDKAGNVIVEQEIVSMQIDGKDQQTVDSGVDFGLKVDGEVKEGYLVYRQ